MPLPDDTAPTAAPAPTAARALSDAAASAAAQYRRAVVVSPTASDAWFRLGVQLARCDRFAAAAAAFAAVAACHPGYADAAFNAGTMWARAGRPRAAIAAFRRAIAARPDHAAAHKSLAQECLRLGAFAEGWRTYEWRWRTGRSFPDFGRPQWDGAPCPERTVLLIAEQGFGDALQFIRYAPMVRERAARVLVACAGPLVRLFNRAAGVDGAVPLSAPPAKLAPLVDLVCPLMSLPRLFATTVATIPAAVPYLAPDPAAAAAWRARLGRHRRPRVGLCWAGNPDLGVDAGDPVDRRRSLALARLAPLLAVPGISWVSLQAGAAAAERAAATPWMIDPMGEVRDFADTAAVVAALDLVISVDTAVAHLAGALGRPVWLLSRFDGCWRWLTERDDSPWYPSLCLFRQTAPGDWDGVVARVAAVLARTG